MSTWVYAVAAAAMGGLGWAAVVAVTPRREPIPREPEPETVIEETSAFAAELRAIDVPAPPNYSSGEWPVVAEARHAAVEEPEAEPIEGEPVDEPEVPAPWWTLPQVALEHEPTPLFNAGRPYPTCDLDLSATNAWNRSDLLARIREAEYEQARGEQAA